MRRVEILTLASSMEMKVKAILLYQVADMADQ
jgi:hypothetical protein